MVLGVAAIPQLKLKLCCNRIWELDYIRGVLLILVTLDHVCIFAPNFLSTTNIAGELIVKFCRDYTSLAPRPYVQPIIIFLFAFLSGINCNFTRNFSARISSFGLLVSAFMLIHKLGTLLLPAFLQGLLVFNILAVLFICNVIWFILVKIKMPKAAILLLGVCLAGVGLYFWIRLIITGGYYVLPDNFKVFALVIYSQQGLTWSINNFEPLLPSLGFFLIGGITGGVIYKNKRSLIKHAPNGFTKPIIAYGKHSLAAYLVAPVVIIAFLALLSVLRII